MKNNILLPSVHVANNSDSDSVEISNLIQRLNALHEFKSLSDTQYIEPLPMIKQSVTELSIFSVTESSLNIQPSINNSSFTTSHKYRKEPVDKLINDTHLIQSEDPTIHQFQETHTVIDILIDSALSTISSNSTISAMSTNKNNQYNVNDDISISNATNHGSLMMNLDESDYNSNITEFAPTLSVCDTDDVLMLCQIENDEINTNTNQSVDIQHNNKYYQYKKHNAFNSSSKSIHQKKMEYI